MYEIVFSGFGGQGILASGVILANAGMKEGKQVTWLPAYGAEQRGGTANCTVIISDDEIGTPFYEELDVLVAMNEPSLDMFRKLVKKDGVIIANSSMISKEKLENDDRIVSVPSLEAAKELGNERVANILILGALVGKLKMVSDENIKEALADYFSAKGEKIISLNVEAFYKGVEFAK